MMQYLTSGRDPFRTVCFNPVPALYRCLPAPTYLIQMISSSSGPAGAWWQAIHLDQGTRKWGIKQWGINQTCKRDKWLNLTATCQQERHVLAKLGFDFLSIHDASSRLKLISWHWATKRIQLAKLSRCRDNNIHSITCSYCCSCLEQSLHFMPQAVWWWFRIHLAGRSSFLLHYLLVSLRRYHPSLSVSPCFFLDPCVEVGWHPLGENFM